MKLWIARDSDNALFGFDEEPHLVTDPSVDSKFWHTKNGQLVDFWEGLFPEVTFENSPKQIEIKLIN